VWRIALLSGQGRAGDWSVREDPVSNCHTVMEGWYSASSWIGPFVLRPLYFNSRLGSTCDGEDFPRLKGL
jgi:hypothetical protein